MDGPAMLFYRINMQDYPLYAAQERSPDRPGLLLAEARALQGIRYAVSIGYGLSVLYFYAYHRPSLPFADRGLARLHHYFFPSAAYSTPVGAAAGLLYCVYYDGCVALSPDSAARAAERERARAAAESRQHTQRMRKPTAAAAAAAKRDNKEDAFDRFLDPCGVLCVGRQVAVPGDAAYYEKYSKQRVDALVSAAMCMQRSPEEQRWLRTAGRLGGYGIIGALLTWNSGGMLYRLSMGLGLGVVVAAAVSGTGLDA